MGKPTETAKGARTGYCCTVCPVVHRTTANAIEVEHKPREARRKGLLSSREGGSAPQFGVPALPGGAETIHGEVPTPYRRRNRSRRFEPIGSARSPVLAGLLRREAIVIAPDDATTREHI